MPTLSTKLILVLVFLGVAVCVALSCVSSVFSDIASCVFWAVRCIASCVVLVFLWIVLCGKFADMRTYVCKAIVGDGVQFHTWKVVKNITACLCCPCVCLFRCRKARKEYYKAKANEVTELERKAIEEESKKRDDMEKKVKEPIPEEDEEEEDDQPAAFSITVEDLNKVQDVATEAAMVFLEKREKAIVEMQPMALPLTRRPTLVILPPELPPMVLSNASKQV